MLWFNEVKDLGFIQTEEGERLSVLGTGFAEGKRPEGRCAEAVVSFDLIVTDAGREAQNVVFIEERCRRVARASVTVAAASVVRPRFRGVSIASRSSWRFRLPSC